MLRLHVRFSLPGVTLASPEVHLSLFSASHFHRERQTINFCVFGITFPSGEEWSVKSNLRNARPPIHNLCGCNYANDRSFSDLYPAACADGALPLWQPAFCFHALYNFVTAGDPALKCWGAHLFERQLDFLCCSFSFALYLLFCSVHLCQCNILIISLSASLLPLLVSLLLLIFLFRLSRSLSLSSVFPSGILQMAGSWTKPAFCVLVDVFVQGFRDLLEVNCSLTHKQSHEYTYRHTPAQTGSESTSSTLPARAVEIGVRRIQCHPLHLMFSCCYCHLCHTPAYIWNTVWMLDGSFLSPPQFTHAHTFLSYKLRLSVISPVGMHCLFVLLLSFCYPWHCRGDVSCPVTLHLEGSTALFYSLNFEITMWTLYTKDGILPTKTVHII